MITEPDRLEVVGGDDIAVSAEANEMEGLLKPDALQAADEAACRFDGMFRGFFNREERRDLIVTIIKAATTVALGLPSEPVK